MNIPPEFAQVNLFFAGLAFPRGAQVTFGVDASEDGISALAIAERCRDTWLATVHPLLSVNVTLDKVRAKLGPNETGAFAEAASGAAGGINETSFEPQVSVLVRKNTVLGGRANAGRMFVGGFIDTTAGSGGQLSSGTVTTIQSGFDSFRSNLALANVPMVLLHNNEELAPTQVASLAVSSLVATQRRRLRKVGGRRRAVA